MASTTVYVPEDVLAAIKANGAKTFSIVKKGGADKTYMAGASYLDNRFVVGATVPSAGWFSLENIVLTRTVADPADAGDKRNDTRKAGDKIVLQLESSVSNAGAYGQMINELQPIWLAEVDKRVEDKTIIKGNRRVVDLLQLKVSDDNKVSPGAIIEDPIVRLKVDFSLFSDRHPNKALRGKPMSQFLDYDTEYIDGNGRAQYLPATVIDPITGDTVPVNEHNLHLFATEGSIIKSGRAMVSSVAITKQFISMPAIAQRVVLQRGAAGGFSDEPAPIAANAAMRAQPVAPAAAPAKAPEPLVNEHERVDDDADVENLLGDI